MPEYRTQEGKLFKLGQVVVFENGRELQTSEEEFEIETIQYLGKEQHLLKRKHGPCEIALHCVYASQQDRIEDQVRAAREYQKDIDLEIEHLLKGGKPAECPILWQGII